MQKPPNKVTVHDMKTIFRKSHCVTHYVPDLFSVFLNKHPCYIFLLYQSNSPGLLLTDASAKICPNKHYDKVIEFKGEYDS